MSLTDLAWLALAAYTLHAAEEFFLNWRDWARAVIGLPVEWSEFYVVNFLVVVLGVVQAQMAATNPLIPLAFAALMLINATFFHVLPVVVAKGRFSPGLFTALLFFYPLGFAMYAKVHAEGALTWDVLLGSALIGAALMAFPIVLLKLKSRAYFRQGT